MPKRTDLHRIMIIGSGPIVIGQACEFDYSGTQAVKALREEGYEVVLVNSNPATIMTDPELADRTYIEPLNVETLERIIERERPDALLSTVGGQTGLNLSLALADAGILDRYGVELIGAKREAVRVAEDRKLFRQAIEEIGLDVPRSGLASTLQEAMEVVRDVGFPAIIRPSFTLGGTGGSTAYNIEEYRELVQHGMDASPIHQVLIEESVIGWKELELEVMRDIKDNVVVICSIENVDPMGIHTGDSITVAPAQTLTDKEYERMRNQAKAIIRKVGVETGGSNIQFAISPYDGRILVIEMNPRVSRSSALASKATGFPIAKIAAKLAVGYTLDELRNDITRETPASFEPTIDYVVAKIPRWNFEKFPGASETLGTQMKSVGEVMAIGRTFIEAMQKGVRSLEMDRYGLGSDGRDDIHEDRLREYLMTPRADRFFYVRHALDQGMSVKELFDLTKIDPWFLREIEKLVTFERSLAGATLESVSAEQMRQAKRLGYSDVQLAHLLGVQKGDGVPFPELLVRERRLVLGIRPAYSRVDTCAGEFEAYTPYLYSTYETLDEAEPTDREKVVILGSGPNRIGQGIEFDYCCSHASFALQEAGVESIMINCNPETVSTDYDTSDRLYFEPLTLEDVLNVVDLERPRGVILQFGGQTPLKLAAGLQHAGVPILGTSPDSIDLAEDRERFGDLLRQLDIPSPPNGTATSVEGARAVAAEIGYPVLVRPSYVLGGRAMAIVYDEEELERYMREAVTVSSEHPILVDRFLEDAFEMDVDCIADGNISVIGGIMEQIELAGVHSGDSACVIPTYMVSPDAVQAMRDYTRRLAAVLNVRGLMNVQYAMKDGVVYVLEVNPRASRTIPFVSKAIGYQLAKLATKVMLGYSLDDLGFSHEVEPDAYYVKEVVLPFAKFSGVDTVLGPEMRSTGEAMGAGPTFGLAYAKAQQGVLCPLPTQGTAFLSVNDYDKPNAVAVAQQLADAGFHLMATGGTATYLRERGLDVETVLKVSEGRPNGVDHIKNGEIALLINTPLGKASFTDEGALRRAAVAYNVPCMTTLSAAAAAVEGVLAMRAEQPYVRSLQEYHADLAEMRGDHG